MQIGLGAAYYQGAAESPFGFRNLSNYKLQALLDTGGFATTTAIPSTSANYAYETAVTRLNVATAVVLSENAP